MTRFEMDLKGIVSPFIAKERAEEIIDRNRRDAIADIIRMRNRFINGEICIEDDGAVYWESSGHYLPEDCAIILSYALSLNGDPKISLNATKTKRDAQTAEFIKAYHESQSQRTLSEEERFEMACAFGSGETVVDVITGQKFTT